MFIGTAFFSSKASFSIFHNSESQEPDSVLEDTLANVKAVGPQFKLRADPLYPSADLKPSEGIQLRQPANLKSNVEYSTDSRQYVFTNKIGKTDYRRPSAMTMKEFQKYETHRAVREYWQSQANGGKTTSQRGFRPSFNIGSEAMDKIFGNSTINIVPQGQAELIFGVNVSKTENPNIPVSLRSTPSFTFDEKIQMNVTGTIGDRLKLGINYNTDATFEFENKTKLEYSGDEDDIVKKVEAGDVTLPLSGSLITGSQSLFGIKTEMQFGKLTATTVLSQQKGQTQVIQMQGGAQVTDFEITADEYEANKHFFIAHTFRDKYDGAHIYLPKIASDVTISKIEVWVTNRKGSLTDAIDVVAFTDLGETSYANFSDQKLDIPNAGYAYPTNEANSLYSKVYLAVQKMNSNPRAIEDLKISGLTKGRDYEKLNKARKLTESEYTVDHALGYISLSSALNADEILAVAYEYKVNGDYRVYKVGQFAADFPKGPLVVKLIKGTNLSPHLKTWDLMMKNIYSLGAYDISNDGFYLNLLYHDDAKGSDINYLPDVDDKSNNKVILLKLMNLDKVNSQMQPQPDGVFDFIDGVTVDKKYGRIIFPMNEPFGKGLDTLLQDKSIFKIAVNPIIREKYLYQDLYDSTQTKAKLAAEKNKFKLKGSFKSSSSSEIYLNAMNVPQGSVKVTAGGIPLIENQDFVVDYAMGTVKIINSGIMSSGQPIKVSLENNSMFNIQTKTLVGTHLNYKVNDDFNVGGTVLHLNERPLTQKVNIGDEPISNTIWGLNSTYRTNSQLLTTLVDKLPFLQTKEISTITLTGEFAQLIPGSSSLIGKNGIAYIDDFEGSETSYDLKSPTGWYLSSTPSSQFANDANMTDSLPYGYDRAKLSWYTIDPLFLRNNSYTPGPIKNNKKMQSSNFVREILEQEVFPKVEAQYGQTNYLQILNLTYYPKLKGPYNYSTDLDINGNLNNPATRWGGIMRQIQSSDFEAANVEYVEFWLMDPFVEDTANTNNGGEMYINLGNISEDILKDGKMSMEQGMPTPTTTPTYDSTVWGRVSTAQTTVRTFSPETGSRKYQDVGLDGLSNADEKTFFNDYLSKLQKVVSPSVYNELIKDPSSDDFHYFKSAKYDSANSTIVDRYMDYNGMDNNSPEAGNSIEVPSSYTTPDMEDINDDNTMSDNESFFEYKVELKRGQMKVGQNYITDKRDAQHDNQHVSWYQFKIPIIDGKRIGDIEDFKSIRFMRLFLTGFDKQTTLRFAKLDLVRGEWRKYEGALVSTGEALTDQPSLGLLDIQAVNIEENANRKPVNYVLPPGITRVIDPNQQQLRQLNEQSMVLKVTDLSDGDARAAFKSAGIDMRQYQRLQMFSHCEALPNEIVNDHDLTVFIRLGTDYKENYYEYEVPLKVTKTNTKNGATISADSVWPAENNFNIPLDIFTRIKQQRNDANVPVQNVYQIFDGKNKVSVCGTPSLSIVKTIMIGVRNPGDRNNPYRNDGLSKSAEIWVDELRLTDFSDKGGWAANARAQIKLADFGVVRLSGSTTQPGFGSIEKKVNDREKVETNQFDIATDLELGKFFPEKAQVRVPMYASVSQTRINPQYNPYDPDIPLTAALANKSTSKQDTIMSLAQDFTQRRALNFTNVKINKAGKTPHIYDPVNFSVTYGYNDIFSHTPTILYSYMYTHQGGFNYIFNNRPKNITPLKNIKLFNNRILRIFGDINFYYSPNSVAFRTNIIRKYHEMELRNLTADKLIVEPTVEKDITWDRLYDVKYDLSRAIKIDFSANVIAKIDEVPGVVSKSNPTVYKQQMDTIKKQLLQGGRISNYGQQLNINYQVPINKLPLLDWTSLNARYGATYDWTYVPKTIVKDTTGKDQTIDLGNIIKNSRNIQLNANASFSSIYSKIGFIRDFQEGGKGKKKEKPKKTVTYEQTYFKLKAGISKSISHKLGTQDVKVTVKDADGKEITGKTEVISGNRVKFTPDKDVTNATVTVEGKVDAPEDILFLLAKGTVKILTGIKSISGTYSLVEGTTLPGYTTGNDNRHEAQYFGSTMHNRSIAPGIPFILGNQQRGDLLITSMDSAHRHLLTTDPMFNSLVLVASNTTVNLRLNYEPFEGLRVDLNANHSYSENNSWNYSNKSPDYPYVNVPSDLPIKTGNFSMTIISFMTFENLSTDSGFRSKVFGAFKDVSPRGTRTIIQNRLDQNAENKYPISYKAVIDTATNGSGYTNTSQQVLIPAFLAAYGNYSANSVPLDLFPGYKYMLPNWRVSYDGLSNIPIVQEYFRSVTLNHVYASTYNISSFASSLEYINPDGYPKGGFVYARNPINKSWVPQYAVSAVMITEQFSPLLGIDMVWKNNLSTRFEYKKNRSLSLSLSNDALSEMDTKEYVAGVGYRFEDVPLIFTTLTGAQTAVKSNVNVRTDVTLRDDITLLRKLDVDQPEIPAGNWSLKISVSADYALSDKLNVRLFYDRLQNDPRVQSSFKTTNTNAGFSIRFTLAQ